MASAKSAPFRGERRGHSAHLPGDRDHEIEECETQQLSTEGPARLIWDDHEEGDEEDVH